MQCFITLSNHRTYTVHLETCLFCEKGLPTLLLSWCPKNIFFLFLMIQTCWGFHVPWRKNHTREIYQFSDPFGNGSGFKEEVGWREALGRNLPCLCNVEMWQRNESRIKTRIIKAFLWRWQKALGLCVGRWLDWKIHAPPGFEITPSCYIRNWSVCSGVGWRGLVVMMQLFSFRIFRESIHPRGGLHLPPPRSPLPPLLPSALRPHCPWPSISHPPKLPLHPTALLFQWRRGRSFPIATFS